MLKECWINVYRNVDHPNLIHYGNCWESREIANIMLDKSKSVRYRVHVKMKEQPIADS